MIEIKRRLEFDAGHRVMNHEGKCKHLHGHRYVVEVFVSAAELDSIGRVVDFGVIKSVFGKWLDESFDHKMILFEEDTRLRNALKPLDMGVVLVEFNPTAENLAELFFQEAEKLLEPHGVTVTRLVVHETPNCSAEYKK